LARRSLSGWSVMQIYDFLFASSEGAGKLPSYEGCRFF
jgi:hypothetical protein